ncbi:hypothetical protein LJC14_00835, partial [Treponema sp. OttesenSCG-928-L16]|nr:hypothetical protein [Treponema sp. OttesenSCG-928-L16]
QFFSWFGVSGRLRYKQWFNEAYDDGGDIIRGIRDNKIVADYMLSLNIDLPFRLFRFMPSIWFGKPWMRVFNFEMHLSPFFDIVLVKDEVNGRDFSFEDSLLGGGLEVIVFPLMWRSFYIRASLGYDLREAWEIKRPPSGTKREIYIGIGHHY